MYKTIGMLLLAITMLLATPTVSQAQAVQLGKPLHCVPMKIIWMAYDQDEDETLVYTAVHSGSSHPVMTYWNTKTDTITTVEFVELTSVQEGGSTVDQQYGCIVAIGDLNRIYDLSTIIKKKSEKQE
tara:strand:+ start:158 stop:538 length:381 start_codon:yes stop_codon:yes gene_type:complete